MVSPDFDHDLFKEFVTETSEALDSLDPLFIKLEDYPDREILDQIFRVMHTAKGNVSVFGFDHIKEFAHTLENLLDRIRQDKVPITVEIVDLLLNGKDLLAELIRRQSENLDLNTLNEDEQSLLAVIGEIKDNDEEEVVIPVNKLQDIIDNWEEILMEADLPEVEELVGELKHLTESSKNTEEEVASSGDDLAEEFDYLFDMPPGSDDDTPPQEEETVEEVVAEEAPAPVADNKPTPEKTKEEKPAEKATIRVEQDAIDGFLKEVGELITLSEGFKYLGVRMADENVEHDLRKDFQDISLSFHQLSMNLQQAVLQVRKVSIKSLTQKIPRMVRSLAKSLDKEVNLDLIGEETTLDKSLVDVLEDPLIHFIRNSMDHGIELPADREGAGKDRAGTLKVEATSDDDHFYLIISDDGNGVNPDIMKKVVVKKGLMSEEEAQSLNDKEAQELIFLPGFSTAEQITDVSGRGVGMDVVMSSIKRVNGEVRLESEVGQGSSFTIKLPIIGTTVVVQSLQFKVGNNIFVIPLENIREVITPDKEHISTVQGNYKILQFRDHTIPITPLKDLFDIPQGKEDDQEVVYIMVEHNQQIHSIMVDELVGIQQVVIKDIDKNFEPHPAISGTALMGDGSIAMVIDCKNLIEFVEKTIPDKV